MTEVKFPRRHLENDFCRVTTFTEITRNKPQSTPPSACARTSIGFQRDRGGEAIPYQLAGAREQSRRDLLELRFHLNRGVLVHPTARLDVDLLFGPERDFKDVAVTVHPYDTVAFECMEMIDEESCAAEQHVGYPF